MSNNINWTPAQKQAIEASNCDLLVSASAGSGKTAVLVERIIKRVTDDSCDTGILEMLVVTFTNAAAAQLRDKLNKEIKKAIALDPKNKRLRRQLRDLPRAYICTINSFCLEVVRSHFSRLGLSNTVRIADEAENTLIMTEIMEQTIEEFYTRGEELGVCDFDAFCDNFAQLRDDSLGEIFMSLYRKLYSRMDGLELLLQSSDKLSESADEPFSNPWGLEIKNRTIDYINSVKKGYGDAIALIESTDGLCQAYSSAFYDDIEQMDAIIADCEKGYECARERILGIKYARLGSIRGKDCAFEAEQVKPVRQYFKDVIKKLQPLYSNDLEAAVYLSRRTAELNRDLYSLLSHFHKSFMAEKYKRGIVSFADCEALTLSLLCDNGEPTETALEYRRRFKEIYIDEYQDVNSVQDAIFRMIAAPDTRFMVGDIKQSIYGFRGAEPGLFGDYRERFSDYTEDKEAAERGCKLFLSNNFRSSEKILAFANAVSRTCFEDGESSIEYVDGDDLVYSKKEGSDKPVTVAIAQKNEEGDAEAVYVCDRIQELIRGGASPSDITILLRSLSSSALPFTRELEKRGIPYYCDVKKEFFDNPEIMLALCWLNTIDNTRRDVFVCGIAKSPVYDFSLDELIRIRRHTPADTLYNSIREYSLDNDFPKGKRFIEDIESLRQDAIGLSAHQVIWKLIYEKGLMSIVTKGKSDSEARIAGNNLLLFYDYARSFENGEFKGIYNFLIYIQKVIEAGQALPAVAAFAGSGESVKIMTIHHSKGLEFPYCFLSSCEKLTSTQDMKDKLFFHEDFGIAARIADQTGLILYDSYIMNALKCRIQKDNIDEEYRVLYVALTRAVDKLWITATAKDPDEMMAKYTGASSMLSMTYMTLNHSYIAWILASLDRCRPDVYEIEYPSDTLSYENKRSGDTLQRDKAKADIDRLRSNIAYIYPYSNANLIPAKMSVSRLYPDILDDLDTAMLGTVIRPKTPFFAEESATNRGAEVGNATHAFMQFCSFDEVEKAGVAKELERLIDKGFLPHTARELVNVEAVEAFFTSELYFDIRASKSVFREKRFNVNLAASYFTQEMQELLQKEYVLVQGVIDCFYYDSDGDIVLVDYKTDSAKDADTLTERHSTQLYYYKKALEAITGRRVKRSVIYSFALRQAIDI
ncbi:MAG: UvrD-helicase domain-containing protein [Clostridia bacterium]|nr:UvrD-helicase domain-containing protein [Clostridia bacterium]